MTTKPMNTTIADRYATELNHRLSGNWVNEEGDLWCLCVRCGGLAQVNEDGSLYGPAVTDPCSGVQGGYVRQ